MAALSFRAAAIVGALGPLLLFPLASLAQAALPQYSLIDLGTLGGRWYSPFSPTIGSAGQAYDLNHAGQVVGYSYLSDNETSRAFLYQDGVMSQVQVSAGIGPTARGINDLGHIVGHVNVSGVRRNFVLADGVTTLLPLHPNPLNVRLSVTDISDAGIVHGSLIYNDSGAVHAGVYSGGVFTDLGTFAANNAGDSDTADINPSGVIVGWAHNDAGNAHAFMYHNGVKTDLGTLGNGLRSYATAINQSGQVVGYGFTDAAGQVNRGFLYDNGQLTLLPLPLPGPIFYTQSRAADINDQGDIVGYIRSGTGPLRPSLWRDGIPFDLTQHLDSSAAGWNLGPAAFINNAGQIIGYGSRPDGHSHMYMLTPTPEPGSSAAVALAGAAALCRRRRTAYLPSHAM